jgi:hypothetical protein
METNLKEIVENKRLIQEERLKIVSDEFIGISLELEEKFKALKSWVQGIAEFGIDSLRIQSQIEDYGNIIPISSFLYANLIRFKPNSEIFELFCNYLEKKCYINGEWHFASTTANLDYVALHPELCLKMLEIFDFDVNIRTFLIENHKDDKRFAKYIEIELICLLHKVQKDIKLIDSKYFKKYRSLFSDSNIYIKKELSNNLYAPKFKEFKHLFKENDIEIKENLAGNKNATIFDEFRELFKEKDLNFGILYNLSANSEATKFDEFRELFKIEDEHTIGLAKNPNATKFEEYRQLFYHENKDVVINVIKNINATKFVKEYTELFRNEDYWDVLAETPHATKFDEFKQLFSSPDEWDRVFVASNPLATKFEEQFKQLFKDTIKVRRSVAKNPNATKFEEYKLLENDPDKYIQNSIKRTEYKCNLCNFKTVNKLNFKHHLYHSHEISLESEFELIEKNLKNFKKVQL